MCGIVAIVGKEKAYQSVLEGLQKLSYRGYDSAGIAYITGNRLKYYKSVGKIENLSLKIEKSNIRDLINSKIVIGHTRWATHGKVNINNTHPIISYSSIGIVHNGIIENYLEIKNKLEKNGYKFSSTTDTEVLAHLIHYNLKKNNSFIRACKSALDELKGAFAFAAISKKSPNEIFVSRKTSPLVLGIGSDFTIIGSDVHSISHIVNEVIYLEDGDFGIISDKKININDKNNKQVKRRIVNMQFDYAIMSKNGYKHFMEKEIFEQPSVLMNTISTLISYNGKINIDLDKIGFLNDKGITICAAGTSFYASMIGKYWIEKISGIHINVELASEFRYRSPSTKHYSSIIIISQSGESIDSLMAMRYAKKFNLKTCAIVNVEGSTIDREADYSIYTRVGQEIGVASTKSFTSQLIALICLALKLGEQTKKLKKLEFEKYVNFIKLLPSSLSSMLKINDKIISTSLKIKNFNNILYLGRGLLYPIALEAALKLKEISYIHSEGFAAGEMKHGPIALIEENLPVIMFLISDGLEEKSLSNLEEAISRGAKPILICDRKTAKKAKFVNNLIEIPNFNNEFKSMLSPILMAIPAQLLAYHVARERGTDVDQPRNLAKSVTVE